MPMTHKEQIIAYVDEGIKAGRIQQAMRQKYIDDFTADPGAAEWFAGGFMRTADYTNKQKERAEAERRENERIAAERAAVARERQELQNWKTQAEAEIARLRSVEGDSVRYREAVARYQQVLRDYKLEEQDPLAGNPAPAPTPSYNPPPTRTTEPTDQWVRRDDAANALTAVVDFQGELAAIYAEHQFLHDGKPLRDNLVAEARAANQLNNIRGYWEAKYNISGKRAELDAKAQSEREEQIRRDEREKTLAEVAADPNRHINPNGSIWVPEQSPLASNYMASRAVAHNPVAPQNRGGETPVNGTPPPDPNRRIPEQIGHVESVRASVSAAENLFHSRFNPDGTEIRRPGS